MPRPEEGGQPEKEAKPELPEARNEGPEAAIPEKAAETAQPLEKTGEGGVKAGIQTQTFQQRRAAAIDAILAEGLNEVFLRLKPEEQKVFKAKGEEMVTKINALLNKAKVKVKKIIDLIKKWLRLLPGVNRFFLEQEAKIKADRIMKIRDKV